MVKLIVGIEQVKRNNPLMKQWIASRASRREAVQEERFHWEQVTNDQVLPVIKP